MMKTNKLRVVLDTNVLMVSFLPHHNFYRIYKSLENSDYTLLISTEILTEYFEKISERYNASIAQLIVDGLINLKNSEEISPTFRFLLIKDDPDDDKFVDCAIAGNADFIVTHDKHFNVLKDIPFPKVETLRIDEFIEILDKNEKEALD